MVTDYSKEIFPLNNFALYCKGWYSPVHNSTNQVEFVSQILYLDGYCFAKNISDILNILLSEIDRYNRWLRDHHRMHMDLQWLYIRAKDEQRLYDCDLELAMLQVIKTFIGQRSKEEIVLSAPNYSRKLYKKGITFNPPNNKGMTYKEKNSFAQKVFNS